VGGSEKRLRFVLQGSGQPVPLLRQKLLKQSFLLLVRIARRDCFQHAAKESLQDRELGFIPSRTEIERAHPEMSGYIVVAPTPYYAQTDKSGAYKIENVPDGSYTVTAWHEGAKNQSKPVNVAGDAKADFTLSK